ncbi:23S rRNA (adenine(2503)-C(2))-methyltransferase RlmN [Patescibacteria group bacterium]|nr:23S rRNA (adenine(2503)-C(2))-methyltransferase RlmN [Patescibacteria group bacterium]
MNLEKIVKILKDTNQPKYRLEQVKEAVYKDSIISFSEITTFSKELREKLQKQAKILSFEAEKVLVSKDKDSIKALLKLNDGKYIESVIIFSKVDNWTACLSCQVGCPLKCAFCATGQSEFQRNLTAEEITDQVLFWKNYLSKSQIPNPKSQTNSKFKIKNSKLTNIVFMGMGEPFLNWVEVRKSLENLINPELFGFGSRSISVSTAGIPDGIEKLVREFPQVNLAISLHFADEQKRNKYMPVSRKYDLRDLRYALQGYFKESRRKVFIEYAMFKGLNDSPFDADSLIDYLKSIKDSYLLHVNLIPANVTKGGFQPSDFQRIKKFQNLLLRNGIKATIRKSLGNDIQGSCGQLAGRNAR